MDYGKNNLFGITITPPFRGFNIKYLYDDDKYFLIRWLNKFSHHYILYPEIAEATSRIHYHGVVQIHDMIKFHMSRGEVQRRGLGFVKISRFEEYINHLRYLVYCRKDGLFVGTEMTPIIYKNLKRRRAPPRPCTTNNTILKYL